MVGVMSLLIKSDSAAHGDLVFLATKQDILNCLKEYKISVEAEELDRVLAAVDEQDHDAINYLHVLDAITGRNLVDRTYVKMG